MINESQSRETNSDKHPPGEPLSNRPFSCPSNVDLQLSNVLVRDEQLLERYLVELDSDNLIPPEEFLDQHGSGIPESMRHELLQSLRSLQLVYTAGRHLTPSSSVQLPGGVYSLGDFQILRPLGRGGMGVVFLARQLSLDRVVALKILFTAGIPDPSMRARFQLEARAAATLHHPHIVRSTLSDTSRKLISTRCSLSQVTLYTTNFEPKRMRKLLHQSLLRLSQLLKIATSRPWWKKSTDRQSRDEQRQWNIEEPCGSRNMWPTPFRMPIGAASFIAT